jgi:urocanate hydratase
MAIRAFESAERISLPQDATSGLQAASRLSARFGASAVERPGVMRHADAVYEIALECAKEKGLNLPGVLG